MWTDRIMEITWAEKALEDYLYWQKTDKKILQRINLIVKNLMRHPFEGIGDPAPLKYNWSGCWSRRIDREHRIVYKINNNILIIAQCRYHY